jgi:hypothetical protein
LDNHAIAMPLSGVFASHFSRRRVCVTTPNDAVLLGAGVPHHYSFPGGVGDHSLVLRWSTEALGSFCPQIAGGDARDALQFASQVSLPPRVIVERELLWRQAASGNGDPLAVEVRALELLTSILGAARRSAPGRVTRRRGRPLPLIPAGAGPWTCWRAWWRLRHFTWRGPSRRTRGCRSTSMSCACASDAACLPCSIRTTG